MVTRLRAASPPAVSPSERLPQGLSYMKATAATMMMTSTIAAPPTIM